MSSSGITCHLLTKSAYNENGAEQTGNFVFDISDCIAKVDTVCGKNVVFMGVDVYLYRYTYANTTYWNNVEHTLNGVSNTDLYIPILTDGETTLEIDCYAVSKKVTVNGNETHAPISLILTQSNSSDRDFYVFRCYVPPYIIKNTTIADLYPSELKIKNNLTTFTDQFFGGNDVVNTSGNVLFEGNSMITASASWVSAPSALPQDASIQSESQEGNIDQYNIGIMDISVPLKPDSTLSAHFQAQYLTKLVSYSSIAYGGFKYSDYARKDENGNIIIDGPAYISGTPYELLSELLTRCCGPTYGTFDESDAYQFIPYVDGMSASDFFADQGLFDSIGGGSYEVSEIKALRDRINTGGVNGGVYKFNSICSISLNTTVYNAVKYLCALCNYDIYFSDKTYLTNGLISNISGALKEYINSDWEDTTFPRTAQELQSLELNYNVDSNTSRYTDYSDVTNELQWVGDSLNTDTGSQNILKAIITSVDGFSLTQMITDSNSTVGNEVVCPIPQQAPYDERVIYPALVGLNLLVKGYNVEPSLSFDVMENSGEVIETLFEAVFRPDITSIDDLPVSESGFMYAGRFIAIRHSEDSVNSVNDIYHCKIEDNEEKWETVSTYFNGDSRFTNGVIIKLTNYPYVGFYTLSNNNWVPYSPPQQDIVRVPIFQDYTIFKSVYDYQGRGSNGLAISNAQLSYTTLSWPNCITAYCIGNSPLTDSEAMLNDLATHTSTINNALNASVNDSTASSIVVGDATSSEYVAQLATQSDEFSGLILKHDANGNESSLTGYDRGVQQIQLNSKGRLTCGNVIDSSSNQIVGASVILDSFGLRTYSWDKVGTKAITGAGNVPIYGRTLQCEVDTDGVIIAGGGTVRLSGTGITLGSNENNVSTIFSMSSGSYIGILGTSGESAIYISDSNSYFKNNVVFDGGMWANNGVNIGLTGGRIAPATLEVNETTSGLSKDVKAVEVDSSSGIVLAGTDADSNGIFDSPMRKINSIGSPSVGTPVTENMSSAPTSSEISEFIVGKSTSNYFNSISIGFGTSTKSEDWPHLTAGITSGARLDSVLKTKPYTTSSGSVYSLHIPSLTSMAIPYSWTNATVGQLNEVLEVKIGVEMHHFEADFTTSGGLSNISDVLTGVVYFTDSASIPRVGSTQTNPTLMKYLVYRLQSTINLTASNESVNTTDVDVIYPYRIASIEITVKFSLDHTITLYSPMCGTYGYNPYGRLLVSEDGLWGCTPIYSVDNNQLVATSSPLSPVVNINYLNAQLLGMYALVGTGPTICRQIRYGNSAPTSGVGNDGDIFLVLE